MNGDWRTRAACRDENPDLFFSPHELDIAAAKEICASCPVADDCLRHAITTEANYGIWAATTPDERRHIRLCANCYSPLPDSRSHHNYIYCTDQCFDQARARKRRQYQRNRTNSR